MLVHFVGDTHGSASSLSILDRPNTIQLGDLNLYGYDFWYSDNKQGGCDSIKYEFKNKVAFISGNHDAHNKLSHNAPKPYEVAPNILHIPRGYVSGETLFIGGGDSIDREYRKEGVSWFPQEKINSEQLDRIFAIKSKIEVVVSHDCPHFALAGLTFLNWGIKKLMPSSLVLEDVFHHFRPLLWIFAHYHQSILLISNGCKFIGLNVDEEKEIEIPIDNNLFNFNYPRLKS